MTVFRRGSLIRLFIKANLRLVSLITSSCRLFRIGPFSTFLIEVALLKYGPANKWEITRVQILLLLVANLSCISFIWNDISSASVIPADLALNFNILPKLGKIWHLRKATIIIIIVVHKFSHRGIHKRACLFDQWYPTIVCHIL